MIKKAHSSKLLLNVKSNPGVLRLLSSLIYIKLEDSQYFAILNASLMVVVNG